MFGPGDLQLPPPKEWSGFESLMRDLTAARLGDPNVQKHGRPGQAQNGVDLFGRLPGGGLHGVQCKKKDAWAGHTVTVEELRAEVLKAKRFDPGLAEFVLATTALDDGVLQREALRISERHARRGLFSVRVEGWNTIADMLGQYPQVALKHYGVPAGPMTLALPPTTGQGRPQKADAAEAAVGKKRLTAGVLPAATQHAFGLLITLDLPIGRDGLAALFPQVDWTAAVRDLRRAGAVGGENAPLVAVAAAKRSYFRSAAERRPFEAEWLAALEPHRGHVDTALMLAFLYVRRREWSKVVAILLETAETVEPGPWNDELLGLVESLDEPALLATLPPADRLSLRLAGVLCLGRAERHADALAWAKRLRHEAARTKSAWHLARADLLAGIVYDNMDDPERAAAYFRRAAERAKRHRHHLVRGHALNNLAMMLVRTDPAAAQVALDESIAAKRLAGEKDGGVAAIVGFGLLAAAAGRHADADRQFARAEKLAVRDDDRYGLAIALCNRGAACHDLGRATEAVAHYRRSKQIAEQEQFDYPLGLAARGLAVALAGCGRHKQAEKAFSDCYELERRADREVNAAVALHDRGVVQLYQKRFSDARRSIRRAGRLARRAGNAEWSYRAARDEALTYRYEGKTAAAATALTRCFIAFKSAGEFAAAARLGEDVAHLWVGEPGADEQVERAYEAAVTCWTQTADAASLCRALGQLYSWRWDHGRFGPALDALRERVKAAEVAGLKEELCRSLDQLGTCLQELGRPDEAAPAHRSALRLARKLGHHELVENVSNNLGELYRRAGKPGRAEKLLRDCETSARRRGETESAISAAHNRALLLLGTGRRVAGLRLLHRCRDEAKRCLSRREYARALQALGNAAWDDDPAAAERHYRRTAALAARHDLPGTLWAARANLAGLLHARGKVSEAARQLEKAEPSFAVEPDGHRFTAFLARCYRDHGEHDRADAAWERTRIRAIAAADEPAVVHASAELAKSVAREGGFKAGDAALRLLASKVKGLGRVPICRAGVELSAEHREFGHARTWLKMLVKEAGNGGCADVVDIHMALGDILWADETSREGAVQAFLAGQAHAVGLDYGALVQAGLHLLWKLLQRGPAERAALHRSAETWLAGPDWCKASAGGARFVLWPFRVADRVGPADDLPAATVERQVLKAINAEFAIK